ncbi:MAG: hypothetical protein QOI95_72 [Acidimicrobiaceae bacterium]|jgi:hypothetical protein
MARALDVITLLPWRDLSPSAQVDVLGWCAEVKPALRLARNHYVHDVCGPVRAWATLVGASVAYDEKFIVVAEADAGAIVVIDGSSTPHEYELGMRLGYPPCCAENIKRVTESRIDAYARQAARWPFPSTHKLCDPSGYLTGRALISHLPCAPACDASLELALAAAALIDSLPLDRRLPFSTWAATLRRLRADPMTPRRRDTPRC